MTEKEVVGSLLAKMIADLSRRPSLEQFAIVVGERDALAEKVKKLEEEFSFW